MADKEAIRPIYSELQGCLAQAPNNKEHSMIHNEEFWEHYNSIIIELGTATEKDYKKYLLGPSRGDTDMFVDIYRQKLGGLIARLHAEYFSDEPVPFANMPSTVIHQSQNQSQSVQLELMNFIDEKLHAAEEGSKEKSFLEKVRGSLSKAKNVAQLIPLIINTAKEMGISIDELSGLFN